MDCFFSHHYRYERSCRRRFVDTLSSWKKLQSLKGMVSVADELSGSGAADRIAKYSIPMGGALTYNFAAKQVNEQILKT